MKDLKWFDLKRFRKANKMSQLALADSLGVTQSFISKVESGAPIPDTMLDAILSRTNWSVPAEDFVSPNGKEGGHLTKPSDTAEGATDIASLVKENEMLKAQVEELKAEKAAYWEMIKDLAKK